MILRNSSRNEPKSKFILISKLIHDDEVSICKLIENYLLNTTLTNMPPETKLKGNITMEILYFGKIIAW